MCETTVTAISPYSISDSFNPLISFFLLDIFVNRSREGLYLGGSLTYFYSLSIIYDPFCLVAESQFSWELSP